MTTTLLPEWLAYVAGGLLLLVAVAAFREWMTASKDDNDGNEDDKHRD